MRSRLLTLLRLLLAARSASSGRGWTTDRAAASPAPPDSGIDYYGGAVVGASTIGARACDPSLLSAVGDELALLDPDDYTRYVESFVAAGRTAAGADWRYADITTVLAATAELLRPQSYLEIGVRRGRSMSIVARRAPQCAIVGVDWWNELYAGIENPGADHVRRIVGVTGHQGDLRLLSGNSHVVVPELLAAEPGLTFDLVTVDGDHSESGARADLATVVPRLRIGGVLVFDDISHSSHPYLGHVWEEAVGDRRFARWEFDDVGYGVALAVRRW